MHRAFLVASALMVVFLLSELSAHARGGGRGNSGGRNGGAESGGRSGGTGRGATSRGRTNAGRNTPSGRNAKEWEALREQEERSEQIEERRLYLMDVERKAQQEALLAGERHRVIRRLR